MNLKLELNAQTIKQLLPMLRKAQPYIYGLALIAVFGYTAYMINQSLNIQPAASQSTITALPKVTFDKPTITALKNLNTVTGSVDLGSLGAADPFK